MKVGESVKVKLGVLEPDNEMFEIGGWQGRIIDIDSQSTPDDTLINIEWDSLTLGQMPSDYIIQSEIDGLAWEMMVLFQSDIECCEPRDSNEDVKLLQKEFQAKYYWSSLGEEGDRIAAVLEQVNQLNDADCFEAWNSSLSSKLTFPIAVVVSESENNESVAEGTKAIISSIKSISDWYGIMVKLQTEHTSMEFPLCDLEVIDKKSPNFQLINDYAVWFANR